MTFTAAESTKQCNSSAQAVVGAPCPLRPISPLFQNTKASVSCWFNSKAIPKQVNDLVNECNIIGPDGEKSHNANIEVSEALLHHLFFVPLMFLMKQNVACTLILTMGRIRARGYRPISNGDVSRAYIRRSR